MLGPRVEGSAFLDAYAGSGAVGLEALSRGAREVVFIEHHRPAIELIRKNLAALKIEAGFRLMTCSVLTGFERLAEEGARFDFVFLDPPYDEIREYHHALRQLGRSDSRCPRRSSLPSIPAASGWKRSTAACAARASCATAMRNWDSIG